MGYPRAELLGQSIEAFLPDAPRDLQHRHSDDFADAPPLPCAVNASKQLFAQRKDGSRLLVDVGLNPITTEDGITVLASITDLSTRRQSEQLWKHYTSIIASSEDAIIRKNHRGDHHQLERCV